MFLFVFFCWLRIICVAFCFASYVASALLKLLFLVAARVDRQSKDCLSYWNYVRLQRLRLTLLALGAVCHFGVSVLTYAHTHTQRDRHTHTLACFAWTKAVCCLQIPTHLRVGVAECMCVYVYVCWCCRLGTRARLAQKLCKLCKAPRKCFVPVWSLNVNCQQSSVQWWPQKCASCAGKSLILHKPITNDWKK